MDRAEMVRSLRGGEVAWGTRNKIADELERLGRIVGEPSFEIAEMAGWLSAFEHALALGLMQGSRPDEARKLQIVREHLERLGHIEAEHLEWQAKMTSEIYGLRRKLKDIEAEHQGCTENAASLVRQIGDVAARSESDRLELVRERDQLRSALSLMELERNGARIERDEAESRHRVYSDDIGRALDSVREKRPSGEPAQPDFREIRRLIGDRNEARAQRDAAHKALDELRAYLVAIPQLWANAIVDQLDALDPRKQEVKP